MGSSVVQEEGTKSASSLEKVSPSNSKFLDDDDARTGQVTLGARVTSNSA